MPEPLFELSDMVLDEISLCPSGDNVGARVVLSKADPEPMEQTIVIEDPEEYVIDETVQAELEDLSDDEEIEKVPSSAYPDLERKKGNKDNWVEAAGGLPSYIERIAKHLHYEQGMTISHAIAAAINQVKKWASGAKGVKPETQAKAAKAVAQWEALKAKSRVTKTDWLYDDLEKGEKHAFKNENAKKPGKKTCDICGHVASKHDVKRVPTGKSLGNAGTSDTLDDNPQQEDMKVPDTQEGQLPEISKDELPAEVVTYIDTLETRFEQMETELADLRASSVTKSGGDKTPEQEQAEVLAKADPAIRALIEKAQQEAATANAIAKTERDQRIQREMLAKAEALPMISEDKSTLATVLREISEKLDPTTVEKVETILKAANAQISEGNLFSTLGRPGEQSTVSKSVESAAAALMSADPKLTKEQAVVKVYAADPSLYDAELKEA